MPKVSVIVPIYNVGKYIGRCIESVLHQSLTDWELILIDDCSPDDSYSVMKQFADKDSRIKILRHNENHGPMIARRWGDMIAKGDYITYCDGDDYFPLNALESLYNVAVQTNSDVVCGNAIYITKTGNEIVWKNSLPSGYDIKAVYKSMLNCEFHHNLSGKLFKRQLLQDYTYITYEHLTNSEDACMLYQILENVSKISLTDANIYYYVQNMESSSQRAYNDNAIRSFCIANNMRAKKVLRFPELKMELSRYITNNIYSLYAQGYHKKTNLSKYVQENELQEYISFSNIIRYLDYKRFIKLCIRRYWLGLLSYMK